MRGSWNIFHPVLRCCLGIFWFYLIDFFLLDSREETVLGSIPLPSYVIAPIEPDDHINRKYAFKVTVKWHWVTANGKFVISVRNQNNLMDHLLNSNSVTLVWHSPVSLSLWIITVYYYCYRDYYHYYIYYCVFFIPIERGLFVEFAALCWKYEIKCAQRSIWDTKSALLLILWSLSWMECDPEEPMSSVRDPHRDRNQVSFYFSPQVFSSMSSEKRFTRLSVVFATDRPRVLNVWFTSCSFRVLCSISSQLLCSFFFFLIWLCV